MEVKELTKEDEKLWEDYIKNSPFSNFFHQIGWKNVIEKTFAMKPFYLLLKDGGQIRGILPLFKANNQLISLPFATEAGVIADDFSCERVLINQAIEISKKEHLNLIEIRQQKKVDLSQLMESKLYFNLILKLNKSPDLLWELFDKKARNSTRKAEKKGITVRVGNIDEFYKVFSGNMRDLGTPVDKKEFFKNILKEFPKQTEILVAEYDKKAIAALFMLYFKDKVRVQWASSLKQYNSLNPNDLLYWEAIKKACKKGLKEFDFGKSMIGEGTYNFKKKWGAKPEQLYYYYYLNNTNKIPDISKTNPKRKLFAAVWKRMPLPIANRVGPWLREKFP